MNKTETLQSIISSIGQNSYTDEQLIAISIAGLAEVFEKQLGQFNDNLMHLRCLIGSSEQGTLLMKLHKIAERK